MRLAVEVAPSGSRRPAAAEEGVTAKEIATSTGAGLGLPVVAPDPADAPATLGWIGMFCARDMAASSDKTRGLLDWRPTGPTLAEDLAGGSYSA